MIQKALAQFARSPCCESVHLEFCFTSEASRARQGGVGKIFELGRVLARLFRIRAAGPIDLLLYPTAGPHRAPMIRDLLLLPWVFLCSRRVVLHFHAAGAAEQFAAGGVIRRALRWLYSNAFAAVVMTDYNRRDPEAAGITRTLVVPHRIDDEFDENLPAHDSSTIRLLYVGHLCQDKGTLQLLQAFARLRRNHPALVLELVGECLPPFGAAELEALLDQLEIRAKVETPGVLTGRAKQAAFACADLFVFPSIAPYESFGLVIVEAMMWSLPIVATNWRGNREVLSSRAGAICFEVSPTSCADDIEAALESALSKRPSWSEWGRTNRRIFEANYRESKASQWLVEPLLSLLNSERP